MRIFLDNGHGIDTKGKCSPDGRLREYRWAREVVKRLQAALLERGHDTRILVPEETDVPLTTRINRVNEVCRGIGSPNCLLVSVHNNAAGGDGKWHDGRGFSVFVSKKASANSKKLASIFTDLALERKMTGNRSVPSCKYWTWSWTPKDIAILKNTHCPAVLTENFFQDNKEDVEYLLSEEGISAIVALHVDAIEQYITHIYQR